MTKGIPTGTVQLAVPALLIFIATPLAITLALAIGRSPHNTYQTPSWAIVIHIATAIPALPLGAYVLLRSKGDKLHKILGRSWSALMMTTAIDSFWIREVNGRIGPIHIFAIITLISVPFGIARIRKGDIVGHRKAMIYSYLGLCSAFIFALNPNLRLGRFLFG